MAEDGILVANTSFGRRVINSRFEPAAEPHVDGTPLPNYLAEENRRAAQGQPSQSPNDDGSDRMLETSDLDIQEQAADSSSAEKLYRDKGRTFLYGRQEQLDVGKSKATAANLAYTDTLLNNDPMGFDARMEAHKKGTVEDATVAEIRRLIRDQDLMASGLLAPEHLATLSEEEKLTTITHEIDRVNLRHTPQSDRIFALFETFRAGNGQANYTQFAQAVRNVSSHDLRQMFDHRVAVGREKARKELNDVIATQGWDSGEAMIADVTLSEFIPGFSVIRKQILSVNLAKAANAELGFLDYVLLGEVRQATRDALIAQGPEEFTASMKAMGDVVRRMEADPLTAPLISKYNVHEVYEAVASEDIFSGATSKDGIDRFWGNFESLVEIALTVGILAKVGGATIRGTFSATDAVSAKTVATASGNPQVAARMDESFLESELADTFNMDPDAATPAMLPRPPTFVDDVEALPDGSKDVLARSERARSEILESTDSLTGAQLTPRDKTNAVNKAYHDIDVSDGLHVQSRMNTLQMLEGDVGYKMRVVVGETAEGGFTDLGQAMDELANLDPTLETVKLFKTNNKGVLEEVFVSAEDFARAITTGEIDASTAGRILGDGSPDETFYLGYDIEKFWHSADKAAFGPETFQSGATSALRALLSPNAKFGPEIYDTFLKAYMGEQALTKNFNIIFKPYYDLGRQDKEFVASAFEWMEDFGKQKGRAPTSTEVYAQYDEITGKQMEGLIAMRTGMDTMHEVFNRKLYREWAALDFKTARPQNRDLPTFHGKVLDPTEVRGSMLDPETGDLVTLSRQDLIDLDNAGGRVMKLDIAIDVPNGARQKADQVLLKEGTYETGALSTKPMIYHPGYSMRFYDDPYYVVKKVDGISVNGSARTGAAATSSEAIATAGTNAEATARVERLNKKMVHDGEENVTFEVVRANDINNTESTLFQKEVLHREGRMFWDERNFDRLPDVNGSRARLEDPVKSLERGIGMAARAATHEDVLRSVKNAWKNDYGDLIDPRLLESFNLGELSKRLKDLRRSANGKAEKTRVLQAQSLIDYMRLIEGTESAIVPALREATIGIAQWLGQVTRGSRSLEKFAQTFDPFRTMRSAAFNAFMVFRPVRQAILQSSQIGYLAALKPSYVATPQFFRDAYGLRRGIAALRKSSYDDGFSKASWAKAMGLTQKEYNTLIREFDRSGLVDLVDVHSFAGGAAKFRKTALPTNQSALGTIGYKARQVKDVTLGTLQKGFNFGESNNLTFTYNLALRRRMDDKGYKSLNQMTRADWDSLKVEASNLALGMVRPNNFGYQTGALGVATQFLSFSHKAALGLLFLNPALKAREVVKIWAGGLMLYGGNFLGAREYAEEQLKGIGVSDRNIAGSQVSLVDLISAGIIDTSFNLALEGIVEDHSALDFGFLAPGIDVNRLWEMQLSTILERPIHQTAFGPFGNIASKFAVASDFTMSLWGTPDIDPADKFILSGKMLLSGALPGFNDANQAHFAYQMNQWYTQAGEALPLTPTLDGILARGILGIRTKEEMAYYAMQTAVWESEQNVEDAVQGNRKYLKRLTSMMNEGILDEKGVNQRIGYLMNMYEDWPEGVRAEMLRQTMQFKQNDGVDTNLYQDIIDVVKNRSINPTIINNSIDQFNDLTQQERDQLKLLTTEAHEGRINVDAKALEALEESQ